MDQKTSRRLKVGVYVDRGSRNTGALNWTRFFHYSPQAELLLVDALDIRDGKLAGLDLLMIPGGSSEKQCLALGEAGMAAVRPFVADGGAYLGVCAGFHCALSRPNRIGLFPYTLIKDGHGDSATVEMELNGRGAEVLGIPPGNYKVLYAKGPIATPCVPRRDVECRAEELGTYRSSVGRANHPEVNFCGRPAILYGTFGKGRAIATSFHPELRGSTHEIAFKCVEAVTGVRITPEYPVGVRRPVRVGYFSPTILGKRCPCEVFELEGVPELDLKLTNQNDLEQGGLYHLDAMIFSDGDEEAYDANVKPCHAEMIRAFMERGGRVLVSGVGAKFVPEHRNRRVLPVGESFVKAALTAPEKTTLNAR